MNRDTGRAIADIEHLRQSVADILCTPIGSRVMRRHYGSLLAELVDHPDNPATRVRVFAAIAGALMRWEPRIRLSLLHFTRTQPGQVLITLDGLYIVPDARAPQVLSLSVPLALGTLSSGGL